MEKNFNSLKKEIEQLSISFTNETIENKNSIEKMLIKNRNYLSNEIFKKDKKYNNLEASKISTQYLIKNKEILLNLNKDYSSLSNKRIELEEQIKILKASIVKAKEEKQNYNFNLYELINSKQELKRIIKKINKIKELNVIKLSEKIKIMQEKIIIKQHQMEIIKEEIDKQLELILLIDNLFQKEKSDSINNENSAFIINNLNAFYGSKQALYDVSIEIPKNKVISIIGPSGCGKSTFLKTLNRINDESINFRAEGEILLDGEYDIYKLRSIKNKNKKMELTELRTKVGMIFQQPNPFPTSIYKNVSFGPKINGEKNKTILKEIVEESLKDAALWDEVSSDLNILATSLSGGQQQRLCIARAIANKPEILLMDEPTSALDPIAASKIEDLILKLKEYYTIIIVTHSMQQAARISDYTAFFYNGKLIEYDKTAKLFSNPKEKSTDDYIRGKFG